MRVQTQTARLAILLAILVRTPTATAGEPRAVKVVINTKAVACKSFIGFGAEWDPAAYDLCGVTDKDFALIERRIRLMKLRAARIMILGKWCVPKTGKLDWNTRAMQRLYRHLDVCQKNNITVFLTDWGCVRSWVKIPGIKDTADPKYAELIGTYLDHLVNRRKYTCIKYFILVNEPNFEAGGWDLWKKGIENVAAVLARRKLDRQITLTGPDHSNADTWLYRAVDQLSSVIGAYDVHRYANDRNVRAGKLEAYFRRQWDYAKKHDAKAKGKPFIVGEAGMIDGAYPPRGNRNIDKHWYGVFMADYAAQAVAAGSSAVLAWMLDDNSHKDFAWGLWSDKKGGMKLRPWSYPWSLLCRHVPPGSTTYRVKSPSTQVRVLAARAPGGGWTFCVVNRGKRAAPLLLRAAGAKPTLFRRYVYSPKSAKKDASGFPLPTDTRKLDLAAGAVVTCPANGVVVVTSLGD